MAPDGEIPHFQDDQANLTPASDPVKAAVAEWLSLFSDYRAVVVRGDEVVQGMLHPGLSPTGPEVRGALGAWPGMHFLHHSENGVRVTLVRPISRPTRERWWLHAVLALATLLTTTIAGAYFLGRDPLLLAAIPVGPWSAPIPVHVFPGELLPGLAFSVPLLVILLGHELGHYLVARRYGMDVSPPYFIPSPNWINLIGTFGAFIRLRSPIVNRVVLLDVGAGGPLASFALSIPMVLVGIAWSRPLGLLPQTPPAPYAVLFGGQAIWLGDSLLFHLLARLGGAGEGVTLLHPVAFAGWLGLFVTALNLFPLSQLDGGHILYALFGRGQRYFGLAFLVLLVVLGFAWWGWWFWAAMILVLGRGTIRHPTVFDPTQPVTGARRWIGWACIVIFLLTFIAIPLQA